MDVDFTAAYERAEDANEQYRSLRAELTRLRNDLFDRYFEDGEFDPARVEEFFDPDEVAETVRELAEAVDGHLLVFVANDFGFPIALRPEGTDRSLQNDVREGILENKYDDENEGLRSLRDELLDRHPGIHKAIVAEHDGESVRYHLPEGSNSTTNFLTVREMVGLVDYTTNSSQREDLSGTY